MATRTGWPETFVRKTIPVRGAFAVSLLDIVDVASPCSADWDDMHGTERVRHCDACALNVYNLSAMTRDDAVQLVQNHEGRLCASFFRRVDGTVLTQDCPVSLRALRRRLASMTASVAALIGVLAAGTLFANPFPCSRGYLGRPPAVINCPGINRDQMRTESG
jgi:hypothetical protein|tara:strand:- start:3956 stop:4444 length:489 start_codon:yes stop_codon:yes gene_type:complete